MNLKIFIPTHNRPDKLERLLEFIYQYGMLDNCIVVDSSKKQYQGLFKDEIEYRYEPDSNFVEKAQYISSLDIGSKVLLCADDDFPNLELLSTIMSDLDSNSFSALIGPIVCFNEHFDNSFWYQKKYTVEGFFDEKNLANYIENYTQILWGLYDSRSLGNCLNEYRALGLKNDNFIEFFMAIWFALDGGVKVCSESFMAREVTSALHWGSVHMPISKLNVNNQDIQVFTKYWNEKIDIHHLIKLFRDNDTNKGSKIKSYVMENNFIRVMLRLLINLMPNSTNRRKMVLERKYEQEIRRSLIK